MKKSRRSRITLYTLAAALLLYALLLIPDRELPKPVLPPAAPFVWDQDQYWQVLESRFQQARSANPDTTDAEILLRLDRLREIMLILWRAAPSPSNPVFAQVETELFELGPMIAARPEYLNDYRQVISDLRVWLKRWSQNWDMNALDTRRTLYRLLYGSRTALEEVMLQAPDSMVLPLTFGTDEPSATPSAHLLGVIIHSGDILLSRGGAPTSALIARGNDYPGNFSHVALVHIDSARHQVSIIESHIEKGVAIATPEEYLKDTKLRVMVLRLRRDLPAMIQDSLLPHRAASLALASARRAHIPYDFAMDFQDASKLFCSEVASDAYRQAGISLWMGLSHISTPGVSSWLAAFGVTHFETQEPSDLEYDPQLRVVAEWRDPETLWKDHLDNAVTDVMLEGAERGERIRYAWYLLPIARVMKAYSVLLNWFGAVGPVPEGMNGTAALRNRWYSAEHDRIKQRLTELADRFREERGYRPPYWELVTLARRAAAS